MEVREGVVLKPAIWVEKQQKLSAAKGGALIAGSPEPKVATIPK
jgi:hypothetical protein